MAAGLGRTQSGQMEFRRLRASSAQLRNAAAKYLALAARQKDAGKARCLRDHAAKLCAKADALPSEGESNH